MIMKLLKYRNYRFKKREIKSLGVVITQNQSANEKDLHKDPLR